MIAAHGQVSELGGGEIIRAPVSISLHRNREARCFDAGQRATPDAQFTRLTFDRHDRAAFAPVKNLCVGELRNWLLRYETDTAALTALAGGLKPEMVAAVNKMISNQDLILVASKTRVVTKFRNTLKNPRPNSPRG